MHSNGSGLQGKKRKRSEGFASEHKNEQVAEFLAQLPSEQIFLDIACMSLNSSDFKAIKMCRNWVAWDSIAHFRTVKPLRIQVSDIEPLATGSHKSPQNREHVLQSPADLAVSRGCLKFFLCDSGGWVGGGGAPHGPSL